MNSFRIINTSSPLYHSTTFSAIYSCTITHPSLSSLDNCFHPLSCRHGGDCNCTLIFRAANLLQHADGNSQAAKEVKTPSPSFRPKLTCSRIAGSQHVIARQRSRLGFDTSCRGRWHLQPCLGPTWASPATICSPKHHPPHCHLQPCLGPTWASLQST